MAKTLPSGKWAREKSPGWERFHDRYDSPGQSFEELSSLIPASLAVFVFPTRATGNHRPSTFACPGPDASARGAGSYQSE